MNNNLKIIAIVGTGILIAIVLAVTVPVAVTQLNSGGWSSITGGGGNSSSSSSGLSWYGVKRNVYPSSLPSSWSLCYSARYYTIMSSSTLSSILVSCNNSKLLLGCRSTGSSMLIVAAMGDRDDVLYNCGSTTSCRHSANGVSWYYSTYYSWGFAQSSDTVNRSPCDTFTTNPTYRLCWLTKSGGGYRCGSTTGLTSSSSYEKVIYHSL